MPTPQDFDAAAEALSAPDSPPEVKAAARRLLSTLPASPKKAEGYTPDISGPTGLDAMLAGGLPADPDAQEAQIRKAEEQNPLVAKALQLRAAPAAPAIPGADPAEVAKAHQAFRAEHYDEKLPTASKRKDIAAPPEYIPPTPSDAPALDFFGLLNQTRKMLPEWGGGDVQHFHEPGIDQFRRDMAPILGPKVLQMDQGSDEYKQYADKLWKDIYAQAKAQNRPVVRESYKNHTGVAENVMHGVEEALGGLASGAIGADRGLTGGLLASRMGTSDKANREALSDAYPLSGAAGFALGAANPRSLGNLAGKGAVRAAVAIPGVARAGEALGGGILGDLVRGAASGGVQGAVAGGVTQGAMNVADKRDITEGLGESSGIGLGLGAFGGVLGGAAASEGKAIRKDSPLGSIPSKEYGETSAASGFKAGPRIEALRDEARAAQIGEQHNPDIQSMLAGRLEEPMVAEGRRMRATEETRVGAALEKYHQINAAERQPPDKYLGSLNDLHQRLIDANGEPLPRNGPQVAKLRQQIREVSRVKAVPRSGGEEERTFNGRLNAHDDEMAARRHETVPAGSPPITESENTTPGGRSAIPSEDTIPDEVTPVGLNDLEMPKGTTIPPPAERPDLHFGKPSAIHAEIKKENPSALRYGANEARRMGYDVDQAIADAYGTSVEDVRREGANGNDMGRELMFIVYPKKFNAGEFHEIVAGVNQDNKVGGSNQPDPRLTRGTERSIRQDRDQYKGTSPEIPRDITHTITDEQGNPIDLKGYSAYQAAESDKLAALKRKLDLAGVGESPPELLPGSPYRGFVGNAREYGRGGRAPEIDQSLRDVAGRAGQAQTLDEIKYARAVADLEKAAQVTQMFRSFGGAVMPTERMSALGLRLRLDPMLQFLAPRAAGIGAAGALPHEYQQGKRLPSQADQATIDQISRLLGGP